MKLNGNEVFEAVFQPVSFANITSRIGIHDATGISDATDGVYLEINSSGVAIGKTSNNSTRSSTASSHTLTAGVWYNVRITVNANASLVTFQIYDDAGTLMWSDTLATNIPTATGRVVCINFVSTTSAAGVADLMKLDYMSCRLSALTRGV